MIHPANINLVSFSLLSQLDRENNPLYNILTDWSVYYFPGEEAYVSQK